MYGPEYNSAKLVGDLAERWANYPVLPARFPPEDRQGVLPSPWVPAGFEADREKAACRWYEEFWGRSTELPRSHPVLAKHGERVIPRAGPMAVLLGSVDGQKEYRIACGTGLALSASGLPVEEPENPDKRAKGWMFDVGGLAIGMGWAPTSISTGNRQVKQILALAVIPHSDQARRKEDDGGDIDEDKNGGSIQFWEVAFTKDENGQLHPSSQPPRFFLAKCFDWGRPKRMQWCPVSFTKAGIYGILAVLCGDGRVRVMDVRATEQSDGTEYGRSYPSFSFRQMMLTVCRVD